MKISILGFLFSVMALGLSLFQYQHFLNMHPSFEEQLSQQTKQLHSVIPEVIQLQAELQLLKNQKATQLASTIQADKPLSLAAYEIASAIRLSAMQLEFLQDPRSAIRLLDWAYKQLETIQDVRFKALREAVMKDKMALEAVKLPDVEGIWLKLGFLISQVDKLPNQWTTVGNTEKNAEIQKASDKSSEASSMWQTAFDNGWKEFKDLVKIQHHDKPIEPLLSTEAQVLTKENLKFLLQQARFSLVEVNSVIYQSSLKEAEQYLQQYFENTNPNVQSMLETVKALQAVQIKPELPNLNQSLQLLEPLEKEEWSNPVKS